MLNIDKKNGLIFNQYRKPKNSGAETTKNGDAPFVVLKGDYEIVAEISTFYFEQLRCREEVGECPNVHFQLNAPTTKHPCVILWDGDWRVEIGQAGLNFEEPFSRKNRKVLKTANVATFLCQK